MDLEEVHICVYLLNRKVFLYMVPNVSAVVYRAGALVKAMRPHHWVKNVVVLAAPLFALALDLGSLLRVGWAFVAFSMTASAFYLINDVRDIEEDRKHPVKQHRPIAAGLVPIPLALGTAAVLLGAGLLGSYVVAPWLALSIGMYAFIQAGYNLGLKEQPIIDIMVIAGGFVLRALGGAAAAGVPASGWFILCIGLLAFFLGIEKRKAELREVGEEEKTRSVLQEYSLSWLRRMESVVTASALMSYALWTLEGADTPWMLATLPCVSYAIFRYQYLSEVGEAETPEKILVSDFGIVVATILWGVTSFTILIFTGVY
ncbi:4-hydroxybenzoate polyprenyltransferase [Salinibacter ruber]|uniref:decaprenyl-phosphate phosphoribosyltransferase n=1 Tax=Salinibacter ruber TaxID=146919 RepID=UPI00216A0740|nr:decaprenyl-phosphate phosphoribosyltransferase [Salinibacter ruber]MCS3861643.1 4-hydroxybenzoate polyprenyltransferase [Salinibacter ruber]